MLAAAPPRGLPGTLIDRVAFQQAAAGRPLDDIVLHAHDTAGRPTILEIQVKRTVSFAPSDVIFRSIVEQVVKASNRHDFFTSKYELAIAVAQTSRKISGAYQEVLHWARNLGDGESLAAQIARPGSANDDMRMFVRTFATHLADFGAPHDAQAIWALLRRLQILPFDFTATASSYAEFAIDRAARILGAEEVARAPLLWVSLTDLAQRIAIAGGDRTNATLREDLQQLNFTLLGERRHAVSRQRVAEDSKHSLDAINNRIGAISLVRRVRLDAIRAAFDEARYVELRGNAGVGKSALLKELATLASAEGAVLVLRPGRTPKGGAAALRTSIGMAGTLRELLLDLASDGGAHLFIDNVDDFDEAEQATVTDVLREASTIAGFVVLVTGRRTPDVASGSWLPADALARFDRRPPVLIEDLTQEEVDDLRTLAPHLAPLLADTHPARDVARNLFRLSRLALMDAASIVLRTEADMAEQWWTTADGRTDDLHRERQRIIHAVALQALGSAEPLSVASQSTAAIAALVKSETLRDVRVNVVAFRHDVLREWAVANLLHNDPALIDQLPLQRPSPPALARGLELFGRLLLEREADTSTWLAALNRVSSPGCHGSWRRAILLALVRSESGLSLLTKATATLLSDHGKLLTELIRVVVAVDSESAVDRWIAAGVPAGAITGDFRMPSGPSWSRLLMWLLAADSTLPPTLIPDVVQFYVAWATATLGRDALTPMIVEQLYGWLSEIRQSRRPKEPGGRRAPFNGALEYERVDVLEEDLRTGFLLFCDRQPALARDYVHVAQETGSRELRRLLKFRGALGRAAPDELATATLAALEPDVPASRHRGDYNLEGPFGFADHELFPASPAQGPFLELLTSAPRVGLSLIRKLADRAVAFYTNGREPGPDSITIALPGGPRAFPWIHSYGWSRDGAHHSALTSAFMALEGWAHRRIDSGESVEVVLTDVLEPPGAPAAYLLVAVDVLLSHWPQCRSAAIPFLGCPELLCLDHQRQVTDRVDVPNLLGINPLDREPTGALRVADLKKRASRQRTLDEMFGLYALGPERERTELKELLGAAAARLDPMSPDANLGDPECMAYHAMNMLDPANWRQSSVTAPDGRSETLWGYVAPDAERQHFENLQQANAPRMSEAGLRTQLSLAIDNPARSSADLAAGAARWGREADKRVHQPDEDPSSPLHDVVTAALIAIRDGEQTLREEVGPWVRSVFDSALVEDDDPGYRFRTGLRFNPSAMAFAGTVYLLRHCRQPEDMRRLLQLATATHAGAAHGFAAMASDIASIDERLLRAILRCALGTSVREQRSADWRADDETSRQARIKQRAAIIVDTELQWLGGGREEPPWPTFPDERPYVRPRIRLPGSAQDGRVPGEPPVPETYVDHQGAAVWLRATTQIADVALRPWLRDVARTYLPWTAVANGSGLDATEEVSRPPMEWNAAYCDFLAQCFPGLPLEDLMSFGLGAIIELPDESFCDLAEDLVHGVDAVYFNGPGLAEGLAVHIRATLAAHLQATPAWKHHADRGSASVEIHLGSAVASLFFNQFGFSQPTKCYLLPKGIDRIDAFLPLLTKMIVDGPSQFVALLTLNLLEVAPRPAHYDTLALGLQTWLRHHPTDVAFWIDHGIGRRACRLLTAYAQSEPLFARSQDPRRCAILSILDQLIVLGLPDARQLETFLAQRP